MGLCEPTWGKLLEQWAPGSCQLIEECLLTSVFAFRAVTTWPADSCSPELAIHALYFTCPHSGLRLDVTSNLLLPPCEASPLSHPTRSFQSPTTCLGCSTCRVGSSLTGSLQVTRISFLRHAVACVLSFLLETQRRQQPGHGNTSAHL